MLGIVSIIICIAMIWLVLVMIKPSKFFFFVKPETKWKRLKAIGIYFVLILALGMVTLLSTLDDTVATADVSKTKIEDSIPEKTVNKRVVEEAPKVKSKPQKDMLDPEKTYKLSDDECLDFRNSHGYDVWNNKGIGIYSWDYGITDSWFNKKPYFTATLYNLNSKDHEMVLGFYFYENGKFKNNQKEYVIVPAKSFVKVKTTCKYNPEMKNVKFVMYSVPIEKDGLAKVNEGKLFDPWAEKPKGDSARVAATRAIVGYAKFLQDTVGNN